MTTIITICNIVILILMIQDMYTIRRLIKENNKLIEELDKYRKAEQDAIDKEDLPF